MRIDKPVVFKTERNEIIARVVVASGRQNAHPQTPMN
jgi:hypothetical protein